MAEASDKGGFDWGGLISGIGQTMSGTAAGLQGDNSYFTRLQAQMDNAAERARRTKLAEDELKSRNEERAITSSKNVMEMLKMAQDVADQAGGDPERARLPGQIIKTLLERNLEGAKIDDQQWQDFMTGGTGSFDGIAAAYEGITAAGLDKTPGFRQALKAGKLDLKEWDKTGRAQSSNVAYQAAAQFAKEHPEEARTMTWDQFQAKIPRAKFASEEDIYRLQQEHGYTIKPPAQLKKETEDKRADENRAQTQAFQAEQQGRQIAAAAANVTASISAADRRFNEGEARRQAQLDRQITLDKRLGPVETRELENHQKSITLIDEYQKAHDELMKETKGQFPAVLKGIAAKNAGVNTIAQIADISGNTPAERRFAAAYNNVAANIRQTGNEPGVMTEGDAQRLLSSFNPATTPEQFRANVGERRKTAAKNLQLSVENQKFRGKDIPPGLEPKPAGGGAGAKPAQSEIEAAKKRLGITK